MLQVSKKSLSRKKSSSNGNRDSISYALLDVSKQPAFLNAFDKSGYKSSDKVLVAYKHRKGKFAIYAKELNTEPVEQFVSSVLNGDVPFTKTRQPPKLT